MHDEIFKGEGSWRMQHSGGSHRYANKVSMVKCQQLLSVGDRSMGDHCTIYTFKK